MLPELRRALEAFPPLARQTVPVMRDTTRTAKGILPILSAARPYTPDLVSGFAGAFFGTIGGYYDANGHYVRIAPSFATDSLPGFTAAALPHRADRALSRRGRRERLRSLEPVHRRPGPLRPGTGPPAVRRLLRAGLLLAFAALALAAVPAFRAEGDSTYRVDVIFDTARGVIPGQLVKVAGASVGSIKEVKVTPGYKARVQLEVDRRFAPFRSDAECGIQPEGLIAENFVQCDPGTTRGRPLRGRGGEAPTVPVERTTLPVTLVDLFEVSSVPVRDRTRLLLNELGVGTMARGEDLNEILRRTNPALKAAQRAIGILNRQRDQLGRIVSATDRVAGELARRRGRVQDFIDSSARVTAVTARHRGALAESVRRLPGLLRTSRPALSALDRFTADAEPLVNQVREAAPRLTGALRELRTFSRVSPEPLRGLRATLSRGRRITRAVAPFTRELAGFVGPSVPHHDCSGHVPRRPEPARVHRRAPALLLLRRGDHRALRQRLARLPVARAHAA